MNINDIFNKISLYNVGAVQIQNNVFLIDFFVDVVDDDLQNVINCMTGLNFKLLQTVDNIYVKKNIITNQQEIIPSQDISGSDTILKYTLKFTPVSPESCLLHVNGLLQQPGKMNDYVLTGKQITWLNKTGTAQILNSNDIITVYYKTAEND